MGKPVIHKTNTPKTKHSNRQLKIPKKHFNKLNTEKRESKALQESKKTPHIKGMVIKSIKQ